MGPNEAPESKVPTASTGNSISQWNKGLAIALTHSNQKGAGSAMARADEYRDYAARCIRLVQQTDNPADKAMLLQMAETWRRLAQKLEQGSPDKSERR